MTTFQNSSETPNLFHKIRKTNLVVILELCYARGIVCIITLPGRFLISVKSRLQLSYPLWVSQFQCSPKVRDLMCVPPRAECSEHPIVTSASVLQNWLGLGCGPTNVSRDSKVELTKAGEACNWIPLLGPLPPMQPPNGTLGAPLPPVPRGLRGRSHTLATSPLQDTTG